MEEADPEKDSGDEMRISTTDSSNVKQQSRTSSHQCKICGAPALHSNYGAMTCSPCKMFFKRNATIDQANHHICVATGECEININNRHVCSSCRLDKCYADGMQSSLIRCPLSKKNVTSRNKNLTTTSNILMRLIKLNEPQLLPTINLLQSDNSTLTTNQWSLLSNLIYSYDESKLLSIAQQFLDEQNVGMFDPTLPKEFFANAYETSGAYIRSNRDLCTLSLDDRFTFLRNATDNVTCLGTAFSWSWCHIYDYKPFVQIFENFYGKDSIILIHRILKFIDSDIVIAKLALSLFAFCSIISIYSSNMIMKSLDTLAIFRIQSTYVEVMWKYLVYKYGYYESIKRFIKVIRCLLAGICTVYDAQHIRIHVNDLESLVEQIELTLVLDDIEKINEKYELIT